MSGSNPIHSPLPSNQPGVSPPLDRQPSIITIGTFDGVHLGHQALIRRAKALAHAHSPSTQVVALVFKPNPMMILRPQAAPPRISVMEQREQWLKAAGADVVVRLQPTHELLGLSPEHFIRQVCTDYHPVAFVEGEDFRFGKGRAGNNEVLAQLGESMGFSVHVVPEVDVALHDHQLVPARSSVVRWLLKHGRVADVTRVLGRAYELQGKVVQGDRRGRTIGYPTANVEVETLIPLDGVYAAWATLPDGKRVPAALSIGTKPTFGEHARAVEAFLIDPTAQNKSWTPLPGLPEYGWSITLSLTSYLREQIKYSTLDDLLAQLGRDCQRTLDILGA